MATISVTTPDFALVKAAFDQAVDGDTITVGPGSAIWTQRLTVNKAVTIQGSTVVTGAGTATPSVSNVTEIIDNFVASNSGLGGIMRTNGTATQTIRITGFQFTGGTGNGDSLIYLGGGGSNGPTTARVDHCYIPHGKTRGIWTDGWVYGVVDHNWIANCSQAIFVQAPTYGGATQGHGQFADYPWYGTEKFLFVEDNTFVNTKNTPILVTINGMDSEYGGRFVARYNYWSNCRPNWHGLEGGGRSGGRTVEVYNNTTNWTISGSAQQRGGTSFWHDNVYTGTIPANHCRFEVFRLDAGQGGIPWGYADGTGPFDQNDTEGDGTYVAGHAPWLYAFGTCTIAAPTSGSPVTFTDGTKNWTPGQWIGYSVKNISVGATSPQQHGSYITDNGTNTITFIRYTATDRGPIMRMDLNDNYQIHRVITAVDNSSRGKGDLMQTVNGVVSNTVAGHKYPFQALEPSLSWNNVHTASGTAIGFGNSQPLFTKINREYYNLGTGHPTTGAIPAAYTGPVYNAALNGQTYTGPFVHPHPLTAGISLPTINSFSTTFTKTAANTFTLSVSNFSGAPTFALSNIAGPGGISTLPADVTFTPSTGVFSGTAATATVGDYTMKITATYAPTTPDEVATRDPFTLTVNTTVTNQPPVVSITAPLNNANFLPSDTVTVTADASDPDGTVASVQFFDGATSLGNGTLAAGVWSISQTFSLGSHALTAKATDDKGSATTSSPAVNITVATASPSLAAPTIVVSAGAPTTPPGGVSGPSFFVDGVSGDDSNAGDDVGAAWKTIQKAMNNAIAGSTVNIKGGTYNEVLTLGVSGTVDNYITFQPLGYTGLASDGSPGGASIAANGYKTCVGDTVLIDYAYLGTVTADTAPRLNINNKSYVRIQGLTFQNFTCNGAFKQGVRIDGGAHDIEFLNNRMLHMKNIHGNRDGTSALLNFRVWNSNNVIVRGNEFGDILTTESEVLTLDTTSCANTLVENNYIHDSDGIAIDIHGGAHDATIRGNLLEYISVKRSDGTLWYGIGSVALYVDGGNTSVIERNVVRNSSLAVEVLAEPGLPAAHHINVRDNVLYSNGTGGNGAILIGTWYSDVDGSTVHDINVLNNTLYNNNIGFYIRPYVSASVVWKNNILSGNTQNISNNLSWPIGTMDYNLYFGGTAGPDVHKVTTNPLFTNTGSTPPNLSLQAGSPAKDQGDPAFVLGSGETDFAGNQRVINSRVDMGAYEVQS